MPIGVGASQSMLKECAAEASALLHPVNAEEA